MSTLFALSDRSGAVDECRDRLEEFVALKLSAIGACNTVCMLLRRVHSNFQHSIAYSKVSRQGKGDLVALTCEIQQLDMVQRALTPHQLFFNSLGFFLFVLSYSREHHPITRLHICSPCSLAFPPSSSGFLGASLLATMYTLHPLSSRSHLTTLT